MHAQSSKSAAKIPGKCIRARELICSFLLQPYSPDKIPNKKLIYPQCDDRFFSPYFFRRIKNRKVATFFPYTATMHLSDAPGERYCVASQRRRQQQQQPDLAPVTRRRDIPRARRETRESQKCRLFKNIDIDGQPCDNFLIMEAVRAGDDGDADRSRRNLKWICVCVLLRNVMYFSSRQRARAFENT